MPGIAALRGLSERSAHLSERLRPKEIRAPSLDWLNFLVADVRGALGPYVIVYLTSQQGWSPSSVGIVMTIGGWAGLAAQTPIGAWLDTSRHKQGLLLSGLAVLSAGAVVIAVLPHFWPVLLANGMMQVVSGVFEPAIAATTAGLFARDALTRRMGRNAAWARAGNGTVAVTSGVLAWVFASQVVFFQVPVISVLAAIAVLSIPYEKIDLRRARGLGSGGEEKPAEDERPTAWFSLFRSRQLVVFGVCSFLYELADAPLLSLVGQQMGMEHRAAGTVITSAFIVAAQLGMMASSIVVGRRADMWGHRRLLAAGFAMLPVQAVLTVLTPDPYWLTAVQLFGGFGTGLFAALTPIWLADITRGTGRYNLSQGVVATLRALGVTTSALLSEIGLEQLGYSATYIGCGALGSAALALLWFGLPERQGQQRYSAATAK